MNAHTKVTASSFAQAFVKVQANIKPAIKDAENEAFKRGGRGTKYADLGAVWDAVKGPLHDNGFTLLQFPQYEGETAYLETILLHESGEQMTGRYPLKPTKNDPQGMGSAITYARRYSICAVLGVIADEDDDGNKASEPARQQQAPAPRRPDPPTPDDSEMEREVQEGAQQWAMKQMAILDTAVRLPDLIMWLDEHGGDWAKPQSGSTLDRLKRKASGAFDDLKRHYQLRQDALGRKPA